MIGWTGCAFPFFLFEVILKIKNWLDDIWKKIKLPYLDTTSNYVACENGKGQSRSKSFT